MLLFQIFREHVPKILPGRGREKVQFNVVFLTWMHLGRQGLPMELPSNFQEHFYMILHRFGKSVGSLFAKNGREIKTNQTR